MRTGRGSTVAAALLVAAATVGCGLGPGKSSDGEATLTVTRDYGAERMLEATESDPSAAETVIRFLDRESEIATRYGGGFVQSIDGVEGDVVDGRSLDWFFFVNGIESSRGAAEVGVEGGDRIWWDLRDWTDALRTPAVVGSWPEPFAQQSAAAAERLPVRVECRRQPDPCEAVSQRLSEEGVDASVEFRHVSGGPALRLLVGPWKAIRSDPVAAALDQGPATSGVFARFERDAGGYELVLLDAHARRADALRTGAGLIAALGLREQPPTWLITGTDAAGVEEAVSALGSEQLGNRYAVAAPGASEIPLPMQDSG